VIGVARRLENQVVLAIVPRLPATLAANHLPLGREIWKTTRLVFPSGFAAGSFRNVITGERLESVHESDQVSIPAATALATCPVALLQKE
jgi:maltooligosyltrehalose synthase